MLKNQEEIQDLLDKLQQHLNFIQEKTQSLTETVVKPSHNSLQRLVRSLEDYFLFAASLSEYPGAYISTEH